VSYVIYKTDGTILTTIPDGTINTTSTSLQLPGRLYPGYGQVLDTNFVWLLQNFASSNVPQNPLAGQLWYNTSNNVLQLCPIDGESNAANWQTVVSISPSSANLILGNLTVNGNIAANNISATNNVSANLANVNYLTVKNNANIANISVNGNATLNSILSTNITTGSSSTNGTLTGNWTLGIGSNIYGLNISAANIIGSVASANVATVASEVSANAQPNINVLGTLTYLTVSGGITSNIYTSTTPQGTSPFNIASNTLVANLNANLLNGYSSNISNTPYTAVIRDNFGNVNGNFILGNGYYLTGVNKGVQPNIGYGASNVNIASADANVTVSVFGIPNTVVFTSSGVNVAGTVTANGGYVGSLITGSQPNITTVGTLNSLTVAGNITTANASLGNVVTANYFVGDGHGLTNLNISSATVSNANYANFAGTVVFGSQPNITSVGTLTNLTSSGNITGLRFIGNFVGNGASISNINGANVTGAVAYATTANSVAAANVSGTVASATVAASANSVAGANVVGSVSVANVANSVSGSNVSGTVNSATYAAVANSVAGVNVSGQVSYAAVANSVAGGNVSGKVANASYADNAGNAINSTNSANANYANSAGTSTFATSAGTASTVTTAAQPNITSVGTLSSLSVSGSLSASSLSGDGGGLANITGANVTGTVANATYAANAGYATNAGLASTVTTLNSPQIISALGFTPYNSTNPSGFLNTSNFNPSAGSPGYITLPGGILMQWGKFDYTANEQLVGPVAYPVPFSNTPWSVIATPYINGASGTVDLWLQVVWGLTNNYNFSVQYQRATSSSGNLNGFTWVAFGPA